MSIVLAAVMAFCPATKFENKTDLPWNEFDNKHYLTAKKRCGEIYQKSPCVKVFRKRSESDFSVICGESNKKDWNTLK